MLLDHQARADESGFQQNGDTGKLVHGLLGWDKLAPESMAHSAMATMAGSGNRRPFLVR